MRKFKLIAIIALAIGIITFNSCKKDEELTSNNEAKALTSTFNPNEIDDMNAYLKDFINDMKSATKDEDATLPLEEAEWHLTACLNYTHCNANAARTDMSYDTITSYIPIDNGEISLADINNSFMEISKDIRSIYNSYDFEDKQIVYIHSTIDSSDEAKGLTSVRTVMATDRNAHFYLNDWDYMCLEALFEYDDVYQWESAADTVRRYVVGIGTQNLNDDYYDYYYVSIQTRNYNYENYYINPPVEQSDIIYNNRLYLERSINPTTHCLSGRELAFYIDSYLGLIKKDYMSMGTMIDAHVICDEDYIGGNPGYILSNSLSAVFGSRILSNDNNPLR